MENLKKARNNMKIYFYTLSLFGNKDSFGITTHECEVVETPKTYKAFKGSFPTFSSRLLKSDIGKITDDVGFYNIALTEPNFEYAKNKFKELAENRVSIAREELKRREEELKIIEESEE